MFFFLNTVYIWHISINCHYLETLIVSRQRVTDAQTDILRRHSPSYAQHRAVKITTAKMLVLLLLTVFYAVVQLFSPSGSPTILVFRVMYHWPVVSVIFVNCIQEEVHIVPADRGNTRILLLTLYHMHNETRWKL